MWFSFRSNRRLSFRLIAEVNVTKKIGKELLTEDLNLGVRKTSSKMTHRFIRDEEKKNTHTQTN